MPAVRFEPETGAGYERGGGDAVLGRDRAVRAQHEQGRHAQRRQAVLETLMLEVPLNRRERPGVAVDGQAQRGIGGA